MSFVFSEEPLAPSPPRVWIKTYGCQMNVYDSEKINSVLKQAGYEETETPENADLLILNTCHIREKAAEKVYSDVGRLRKLKKNRPHVKIAVAGCVAQAEGEEMVKRAPEIDFVLGPQSYHLLPQQLKTSHSSKKPVIATDFSPEEKFSQLEKINTSPLQKVSSFVTIQEGCDKFCTFCVVPYTRGEEFSRPVEKIEKEILQLSAQGVREFTLLGQNVNAYHGKGPDGLPWSLGRLLERLSHHTSVERLRYTTSHPNEMSDDLIDQHRDNPKVMPYLHLPVQSGSDRILKAMNRRHTAKMYRELIDKIRKAKPDIAISGDFIVGFPSETEEDFLETLKLAQEIGYANAFSFKYSPRPGTKAALSLEQVPEEIKSERLGRLQRVLLEGQQTFNAAFLGRDIPVLLEKAGRHRNQFIGRSPYLQSVHLNNFPEGKIGTTYVARITEVAPHSLGGEVMGT